MYGGPKLTRPSLAKTLSKLHHTKYAHISFELINNTMPSYFKNARAWLKTHFSKGLLVGIVLSVLLHLMMIVALLERQSSDARLSSESTLLIDATLLQPKPILPKPNIIPKDPIPQLDDSPKPLASAKAQTLPADTVSDNTYRMTDAVESATDESVILNGEDFSGDTGTANAVAPLSNQEDASLAEENVEVVAINPDAYQYVETYFDVRTDISAKPQASPAGNAKIIFQLTQNNSQYQIESFTAPKGLAALFISNLTQKSVGNFTSKGLQPLQYDYQFGDKADKTYRATFDWQREKLSMTTIKGTQIVNLTNGAQDLLSFMYQLMYVPPLNNLQFNITNGKKFAMYSYLFEGEESVDTKMGALNTVHIARENDDHDEKTDLWLATDYQYLPVKIRKTEKNGKVYELLATKILTKAP